MAVTHDIEDRHALCPHCGYDLYGAPSACCPECGKLFDWTSLLVRADEMTRRRTAQLENCMLIMFGVAVGSPMLVRVCPPLGFLLELMAVAYAAILLIAVLRWRCSLDAESVLPTAAPPLRRRFRRALALALVVFPAAVMTGIGGVYLALFM